MRILSFFLLTGFVFPIFSQSAGSLKLDSLKNTLGDKEYVNYLNVSFRTKIVTQSANLGEEAMIDALEISKKNNWKESEAYSSMYLGISQYYQGKFDLAIINYLHSATLFDSLQLSLGIAKVSNEIGIFYSKQENRKKAFEYWDKAAEFARKTNSIEDLGTSVSNKGLNHLKYNEFDKAFPYIKEALSMRIQTQDSVGMGYELKRLATYYFGKNQFEEGERHLAQSSEIRTNIGDKTGLAVNQVTLAEVQFQNGQYGNAVKQFEKTQQLAKEINFLDLERYTYGMIQQCYSKQGNYEKAYESLIQEKALGDSILNVKKQEEILELETQYETAQKEQEITEKELEIQTKQATIATQQNMIILIASGAGFIILFGFIFYNQNKGKQKQALAEEKENGFKNVINATEQERNRISKDLHDGIGQELSALKLSLNSVIDHTKDDDQKKELTKIASSFSKSADEVRSISHQMMPRALMEKGLIPAIDDLLKNAFQHSNTSFTLEESGVNERFNERIEVSVYRIIQELVNNIIKHAEASHVNVQLICKSDQLLVFVEDNGKGFDASDQKEGHGLINIKSRTEMINGSVNFEPSSNKGTFVSLSIPLSNHV